MAKAEPQIMSALSASGEVQNKYKILILSKNKPSNISSCSAKLLLALHYPKTSDNFLKFLI
jgi:hypothetical protein